MAVVSCGRRRGSSLPRRLLRARSGAALSSDGWRRGSPPTRTALARPSAAWRARCCAPLCERFCGRLMLHCCTSSCTAGLDCVGPRGDCAVLYAEVCERRSRTAGGCGLRESGRRSSLSGAAAAAGAGAAAGADAAAGAARLCDSAHRARRGNLTRRAASRAAAVAARGWRRRLEAVVDFESI